MTINSSDTPLCQLAYHDHFVSKIIGQSTYRNKAILCTQAMPIVLKGVMLMRRQIPPPKKQYIACFLNKSIGYLEQQHDVSWSVATK